MVADAGEQLGIMPTVEALRIAAQKNLDLVKIAPQATPPVCKIMDYGKYRFDQQKREKAAKVNDAVRAVLKEIGVADKRIDAVMRVTDTGELELDENGKIVTEKELKKQLKDEWADFIVTRREQGANVPNPPENNGGGKLTKAEIYAKDEHGRYKLSTAERQKAIAENPDYMKG